MNSSISGKTQDIDWNQLAADFQRMGIIIIQDTDHVKKLSQDYFHYSPILIEELDGNYGDLVVRPETEEQVLWVISECAKRKIPITVRGGGTGGYGQAVPLKGGVILDTTKFNKVLSITDGSVTVQAGARILTLQEAVWQTGQDIMIFPSTRKIATIGGFISGGSGGIGSVQHGMLREEGVIRRLRVATMEPVPRVIDVTGPDINKVHHAWGINGIVLDIELTLVPKQEWIHSLRCFNEYGQAYDFAWEITKRLDIVKQQVTTIDARITTYIDQVAAIVPEGKHIACVIVSESYLAEYRIIADSHGGTEVMELNETEIREQKLLPLNEFAFVHTILQVRRKVPSATYAQILFPPPRDTKKIKHFIEYFGDEVLMHHEFNIVQGEVITYAVPVLFVKSNDRIHAIQNYFEEHDCPVSNAHNYILEEGGMKSLDYSQLAIKKQYDPEGLLNPGKSRAWYQVKDMTPEEINSLQEKT